jgi:hypothetical protein
MEFRPFYFGNKLRFHFRLFYCIFQYFYPNQNDIDDAKSIQLLF